MALVAAALLAFAIGLAHSYLGERYILVRLLRRDLPKLFGSDEFTKKTLRFAWHVTTLAWWGLGGVLALLAAAEDVPRAAVLQVVAATFAATGLVAGAASRGRHLSWIVFLAIAWLAWRASL